MIFQSKRNQSARHPKIGHRENDEYHPPEFETEAEQLAYEENLKAAVMALPESKHVTKPGNMKRFGNRR